MSQSTSSPAAKGDRSRLVAGILIALSLVLLSIGSYIGLFVAPPEFYMGDVQRIMYIHVPTAWNGMLALTFAMVMAVAFLVTRNWKYDTLLEAGIEVGVVFSFLLCVQGSLWAKPTWGVWWDWDPRLTTVAVMLFAFLGVLALRHFVEDPVRRAAWSAVATIVSFADVPIVYFSVRWWNSLHQLQTSPKMMDKAMARPLHINALAVMALAAAFIILRAKLAETRLRDQLAPPLPEANPSPIALAGAPEPATGGKA